MVAPALLAHGLLAVASGARLIAQNPPPPQDLFAADVRATPWLSPEDERRTFTLPPGFVATCFAHEPALFKPMNLAFDARGRLWCTNSTEYPYPVRQDRNFTGRDRITIFEDLDGDGVADKSTVFADGLDIPIGLLPTSDGCIVFSIPDIWRLRDVDGDDKADVRDLLYGPMGWERDTHGLNNSFRRGADGWVYANHGYNNHTRVKGKDGHEIYMESGNTYRFRIDGSRIEQFTSGQVNPFGSAFSPLGDLYTADCHTLPITVLLREGCYESFGKPHDGLGFAPVIMHHLHGSTALCGLAYEESGWPAGFRDNVFVGNVMTCRVHRDRLVFDGSTPKAVEQLDLVETTDPWFRPVDLQIGPDGALYVADFYNRIIGHYEVPLDHPGRDRTSGRIWRIAYAGDARPAPRAPPDLRAASPDELVVQLAHPQQSVRVRALDELSDRIGRAAVPALQRGLLAAKDANARALSMWGLFRLDSLSPGLLQACANDGDRLVRVHARRVLAETREWDDDRRGLALRGLEDEDPFVRRAAADALSTHPDSRHVAPLLQLLRATPAADELLRHAAKIALRDQLRDERTLAALREARLDDADRSAIASACMGIASEAAGSFLLDEIERERRDGAPAPDRKTIAAQLGHAADVVAPHELSRLAQVAGERFADDPTFELELIQQVQGGLDRRALPPSEAVSKWAGALILAALAPADVVAPAWRDAPVAGVGKSANPWCFEERSCADGGRATLLSSLPRGEALTGAIRSPPFPAPAKLAFWCCGHNGEPDRTALPLNQVRIRDAASDAPLATLLPPRDDVARRFEVDLSAQRGKPVVVELVDGSPYDAYAWLAVGRFDPAVVTMPAQSPGQRSAELVSATQLAARFKPEELAPRLAEILRSPKAEPAVRAACATALVELHPDPQTAALAALLDDPDTPAELIEPIAIAIAVARGARDAEAAATVEELALHALEIAPSRMHLPLATALVRTRAGASALLDRVAKGKVPPALLLKPALKDAIAAALPGDGVTRVAELTKDLPPEDDARQRLINDRRKSYARFGGDAAAGQGVFQKSCAACHKLAGTGTVVGPQLDGIASRGFERLCEDILAPNRNVDVQFVRTNYFMKSGDIVSALYRRTEGETIVVADEQGKESALKRADVAEERVSRFSLMPDNFGEILSDEEFRNLLAWLMSVR
jgi:putative heme-binding domain-containing protein